MMSPSKLGVFAHLALAASAVLIPSTISTAEDLGDDHAFESPIAAINPSQRSVALECPGCAFATLDGETLKWKAGAGNAFVRSRLHASQPCILTIHSAWILRSDLRGTL
jgi:hypothetical protein